MRFSVRHLIVLPFMANVQLTSGLMSESPTPSFPFFGNCYTIFSAHGFGCGSCTKRGSIVGVDPKSVVTVRL
jgi:hypothetical protein